MRRFAFLLLALLTPASGLLAHPGHGTTDPGTVVHHVAEPFHMMPVVLFAAALACVAAVVLWMKRSR